MSTEDLSVPVLSIKAIPDQVQAQLVLEFDVREAAKLVLKHDIIVLQSEVHTYKRARWVKCPIIVTLDGPHGPIGPRQLCVEDQQPLGTQEEIELIAWLIEWLYNYIMVTRLQEGED